MNTQSIHCQHSQERRVSCGFSLVEVVIALGILSFALMGIVGLLPAGLSQFRQAIDISTQSQIAQALIAELQREDYSAIQSGTFYFDSEGRSLATADREQYAYTATATVLGDSGLDGLMAPTWSDHLSSIKAVKISIVSRRDPATPYTTTTYVAQGVWLENRRRG
ncbi:MAG: Verru_Chthon cassette protein B [Chthoniobacterales bacterium]